MNAYLYYLYTSGHESDARAALNLTLCARKLLDGAEVHLVEKPNKFFKNMYKIGRSWSDYFT